MRPSCSPSVLDCRADAAGKEKGRVGVVSGAVWVRGAGVHCWQTMCVNALDESSNRMRAELLIAHAVRLRNTMLVMCCTGIHKATHS